MCISCWNIDSKAVLHPMCLCVRQIDKSQYVPTRHSENKSVRMEHVTHHCVWMWRSEAMCGQGSLLHSWLKSNLTYTKSHIASDTSTQYRRTKKLQRHQGLITDGYPPYKLKTSLLCFKPLRSKSRKKVCKLWSLWLDGRLYKHIYYATALQN